jgi:14-3-3 protein epsilon
MSQGFTLGKFKALFQDERKDVVYLARTAETAERYEDMCQFMRELVTWCDKQPDKPDLTVEERNLLSVAYKNVIGARRATWRTLNADERKDEALLVEYRKQVENELKSVCRDVLGLLEDILLKNQTGQNEAQVFYLKMAGDYYRYLAEFVSDQGYATKANDFYSRALKIAESELAATHPIRLGLALNCSVCFYEILKDKNKACDLAKKAFDDAISRLEELDEASYKDSTLIMQLLRDNLTLWTSEGGNEDEV